MSGALLTISCPRCSFSQQLPAEHIVEGPLSQTCPSCGLLFRVGRSLGEVFPSDPTFETEDGWYVRKESSEILYFPNLEILRRWSLEGHVTASDEVSKRGKSWRPIYDLPEFASMMVWQDNATGTGAAPAPAPKSSTLTGEIEQVSEEMIEVEEFSVRTDNSRGIWSALGLAFLLGLGSAVALIFFGDPDPAELGSLKSDDTSSAVVAVAPEPDAKAPEQSAPDISTVTDTPMPEDTSSPEKDAPEVMGKAEAEVSETREIPPKKTPKKKSNANEGRKRKRASKREGFQSYDSLMERGSRQLRSQNTASQAVQTFMTALQFPEATSEARAKLGRAFLLVGDMESAIKHLEKARKRNPGYRPALWDLARAYQQLGKREKAISIFRALSDLLDPDSRQGQQVEQELQRMGAKP